MVIPQSLDVVPNIPYNVVPTKNIQICHSKLMNVQKEKIKDEKPPFPVEVNIISQNRDNSLTMLRYIYEGKKRAIFEQTQKKGVFQGNSVVTTNKY